MYRQNFVKAATLAVVVILSLLIGGATTVARAETHSANGTYTWNLGTGTFAWNMTTSDFTCDGPSVGTETHTGVTITTTTMTWPNDDGMTWTRSSRNCRQHRWNMDGNRQRDREFIHTYRQYQSHALFDRGYRSVQRRRRPKPFCRFSALVKRLFCPIPV